MTKGWRKENEVKVCIPQFPFCRVPVNLAASHAFPWTKILASTKQPSQPSLWVLGTSPSDFPSKPSTVPSTLTCGVFIPYSSLQICPLIQFPSKYLIMCSIHLLQEPDQYRYPDAHIWTPLVLSSEERLALKIHIFESLIV